MHFFTKGLIFYLAFWMVVAGMFAGMPTAAYALLMPSELATGVVTSADQRVADLEQIQSKLESKLVAQRLSDLGLTQDEVQTRIQSLTDDQLHQVAQNLDGVQMGGELLLILAIVGAVVLVLALIGAIGHGHH
jgi:uncharacterized protein DUF6627